MSYEGHHEDRAKVLAALGGTRGLLDSGLPSILFLLVFNISHNLNQSALLAIALSVVFAVLRLVKRETVQHAISGVVGVAFCALLARHTGKAADFYLPGLIINVIYGTVYTIANLAKWPILGLLLGPVLGENLAWRKDSARRRAYIKAGWIWVALFASRLIVQYPLYKTNHINLLGTARLVMGTPLFILTAWATWLVLRRVPTAKVVEESE
jgi:intracellular septation protein A